MKIILSYLLLCIYATIMIKPVMPTVSDIVAHVFNYSDHMVNVHHQHGKAHVHLEYIEAAKKGSRPDAPLNNTIKKTNDCSEHILFTTLVNSSGSTVLQKHASPLIPRVPAIYCQDHFHPPIGVHL